MSLIIATKAQRGLGYNARPARDMLAKAGGWVRERGWG
jgi:hypothetical protein